MKTDLYKPEQALPSSGKEIDTSAATTDSTKNSDVIDTRKPIIDQENKNQETQKTSEEIAAEAAAATAAAGVTKTAEEIAAETAAATAETQRLADESKIKEDAAASALQALLSDLGVSSLDELKNKIPGKVLTPEEIVQNQQLEKASIAQYAVKNNKLSMDEITRLESLKAMDKKDLAISEFGKAYKEAHKDRLDEDQKPYPVTPDEIEDAFNDLFHLNSDDPAMKKAGEASLERYTNGLTDDLDKKYQDVTAEYKDWKEKSDFFPTFKKFMTDEVIGAFSKEITFGEGDDKVTIDTSLLDVKDIDKKFVTNEIYDTFFGLRGEQKVRDSIQGAYKNEVLARNIDKIVQVARTVGFDAGKLAGANGSTASFTDKEQKLNTGLTEGQTVKKVGETFRKEMANNYSGRRN